MLLRVLVACLLLVGLSPAEGVAQSEPFTGTFSGSLVETQTDTDGDGGATADVGKVGGRSPELGDFTAVLMLEMASVYEPEDCEDGSSSKKKKRRIKRFVWTLVAELIVETVSYAVEAVDQFLCEDEETGEAEGVVELEQKALDGGAQQGGSLTVALETVSIEVREDGIYVVRSINGTVVGVVTGTKRPPETPN